MGQTRGRPRHRQCPRRLWEVAVAVRALARPPQRYKNGGSASDAPPAELADAVPPGQTALFNAFEDAVECAKCGGRMIRTGSCYTCRDCGTNTGCS